MKIEMAPWVESYTVKMDELYTDLTVEKIENKPTGPEGEVVNNYSEIFTDSGVTQEFPRKESKRRFKKKGKGRKILIKSDRGMGKTTFGEKVAYDWAKGVLKTFSIVFLVLMKLIRPGLTIENVINVLLSLIKM